MSAGNCELCKKHYQHLESHFNEYHCLSLMEIQDYHFQMKRNHKLNQAKKKIKNMLAEQMDILRNKTMLVFEDIHNSVIETLLSVPPSGDIIDGRLDMDKTFTSALKPSFLHLLEELQIEESVMYKLIKEDM